MHTEETVVGMAWKRTSMINAKKRQVVWQYYIHRENMRQRMSRMGLQKEAEAWPAVWGVEGRWRWRAAHFLPPLCLHGRLCHCLPLNVSVYVPTTEKSFQFLPKKLHLSIFYTFNSLCLESHPSRRKLKFCESPKS